MSGSIRENIFFHKKIFFLIKPFVAFITGILIFSESCGQCINKEKIIIGIAAIEGQNNLSDIQKLNALYILKRKTDSCR